MLLAVGLAQSPHKAEPAMGFPAVQVEIGRARMNQEQLHHPCLVQSPSRGQGQHPLAAFWNGLILLCWLLQLHLCPCCSVRPLPDF